MSWFRSDRGSSPATMLILIPVVMMIVELAMVGGRVTAARADLATAAREGARVASLAQTAGQARTDGWSTVSAVLDAEGVPCTRTGDENSVDTSAFERGGQVVVTAECTVTLSDLGFLQLPFGSANLTSVAVEPVDYWRVVE